MSADDPAHSDGTELADRRPLTSRDTGWARALAAFLASTSITPNQVSFGSIVAALATLMVLWCSTLVSGWGQLLLYVAAAIGCQLRLICNLMDGMVAIEAGKQTRDGAVWNELPDRVADVAILVGVGIAAGSPVLGWVAATLAVSIAYVRELGKAIDGIVEFTGPMAKPHRMALVTVSCILAAASFALPPELVGSQPNATLLLIAALWICIAGCLMTLYRRTRSLLSRLQ